MADHSKQPSTPKQNDDAAQQSRKSGDRSTDTSKTYDVMDLVSKGGYEGDPQEIIGNPAVTPETYQEGRDLRVDLFRESDEAAPQKDENLEQS
jgi:hypothetical protein